MNYITSLFHRRPNPDLSQMSPDIQQQILSQFPELIRIGRQLNRDMRNRLFDVYREKICQQPPTKKELLEIDFFYFFSPG